MFVSNLTTKISRSAVSLLLVSLIMLGGCVTEMEQNPKQTIGKILGAGLGALSGAQIGSGKGKLASVAIGTLAGAWFGGEIGKSLDKADRAYIERSAQESLKTGSTVSWNNPDSGNSGSIKPTHTFQKADGQYCRDFEQTIYVKGNKKAATGRACRDADGSWKIVS